VNLKTVSGSAVELSEVAFGREFNEALVHQVVTAYLAGGRQGSRAQKSRADVSGGGKNHSVKKVLVALVLVLFVAQSGLVVVKLLLLVHKIGLKKLTVKCTAVQCNVS
jgi:hypothetical protein